MLAELAQYARSNGLDTEPGFRSKDVKWLLLFNVTGNFIDIAPYGVAKKGRNVPKCPHLQFSGDTPMRQFLVDTTEYYALLGGVPDDAKRRRKHAYAIDLLAQAGSAVPGLAAIAEAMSSSATIDAIRAALTRASAKPADNATPVLVEPDGKRCIFLEEKSWHDWWRSTWPTLLEKKKAKGKGAGQGKREGFARCLATGALCDPALTHPKVRGLGDVGGRVETALVSFDPHSFRSYGLKQSANAPVSVDAANAYVGALNDLIERTGQRLGNVKVIHWFADRDEKSVELPPEEDALKYVDSLDDIFGPLAASALKKEKAHEADADRRATEQYAQSLGRKFLRSVASGERTDLTGYRYHAMTLSGSSARVMVRDYVTGRFRDLCAAITAWFDDLDIVARDGRGLAPSPRFGAVLAGMVRELKDVQPAVAAKLWRCAVVNQPIPEAFAAQALRRASLDFLHSDAVKHARMGLLRAHLYRRGDLAMKPYLNEEHPDAAYHCGRLLAVLDDIQYAALGDVGAGVVQRYYAAASATPALVLGRLIRLANTGHLPKLGYDRRQRLETRLASVWGRLEQDPPATLSLARQTLFAMGYYQQKASH